MPVIHAFRISISLPIIFSAVQYHMPGRDYPDLYIDGGVMNNFPID